MEESDPKSINREIQRLKYEALNMSVIKMFVEKYPDDIELGKAVREFVNLKFKSQK